MILLMKRVAHPAHRNRWNMVRELAIVDFKLKYQGSFFGYLWSLLKPLAVFWSLVPGF
jgi:ABC-2 type transport system permease protein